jgi:hypothetical protein
LISLSSFRVIFQDLMYTLYSMVLVSKFLMSSFDYLKLVFKCRECMPLWLGLFYI